MRVFAVYAVVVALWGTTPLAIKWSGEGPGFLFGVISRMAIGTLCVLPLLGLLRVGLPLHRKALLSYVAGAVQIFGAMLAVYWAAQYLPSGWISVIFGLSPLLTALMAAVWLGERSLTAPRLLAYGLGVGGLAAMYGSALEFGPLAALGIGGVLLSAVLQAASAIWIKRVDARVPALAQLGGALLVAMPAYLLTWVAFDAEWPERIAETSLWSILYLGVVATSLGFALYFYLLQRLSPTRVALITLVSPVIALVLGNQINGEPIPERVAFGTALILGALLLHEWRGPRLAFNRRDRGGFRPGPASTRQERRPAAPPEETTSAES